MDLLDVTPEELTLINKQLEFLQNKWGHRSASKENLQEFAYEVTARYAELGFIVNVDITPCLVGVGMPDVAFVGRINPVEPDHDRYRWQIKKERSA
jgi:hypothetical protein